MDRTISGGYYGHDGYHLYSILDLRNVNAEPKFVYHELKALQVQVEGTSTNFPSAGQDVDTSVQELRALSG